VLEEDGGNADRGGSMKKIRIEIETVNAAFENPDEIPRILRELAVKWEQEPVIHDINGNRVGSVMIED
jgi:hypothetical protein